MEWELICRSYVVKLGKSIGIGIEVLVFGPVLVLVLVLTLRHSRVLVLVLSIDLGQMGVLVLVLGIGLSQIGVLVLVLSIGLSQILVLVLVLRYEYWYCWCLLQRVRCCTLDEKKLWVTKPTLYLSHHIFPFLPFPTIIGIFSERFLQGFSHKKHCGAH